MRSSRLARAMLLVAAAALGALSAAAASPPRTAGATPSADADGGWRAWQGGRIEEARARAEAALGRNPADDFARHLRILTSFLAGDYAASLADYSLLPPTYPRYADLATPILDAYVHLGRFPEAIAHARRSGLEEGKIAALERRRAAPMSVTLEETTVLHFLADDFLAGMMPAVEIELNGWTGAGHLDTGGSFVIMGPEKAAALDIETSETGAGVANAQETRVFTGIADSLRLGDALLANVPVTVVETLPEMAKDMVILGTNVLQPFLVTWSNQDGFLALSPRGSETVRAAHLERFAADALAMPFYLIGDHYLWARGGVGDRDVLFFVDTGLVAFDESGRQAAGSASAELLSSWGHETEDARFVDGVGPLRLGPVSRPNGSLMIEPDDRNRAMSAGLRPEVLLSHGFLKHFDWTLDFDSHTWLFAPFVERPAPPPSAAGSAPDAGLARYAGRYEVAPQLELEITVGEGILMLRVPGQQRVPLADEGDGTFSLRAAGAEIVFEEDDEGRVIGLALIQAGNTTRARKTGH